MARTFNKINTLYSIPATGSMNLPSGSWTVSVNVLVTNITGSVPDYIISTNGLATANSINIFFGRQTSTDNWRAAVGSNNTTIADMTGGTTTVTSRQNLWTNLLIRQTTGSAEFFVHGVRQILASVAGMNEVVMTDTLRIGARNDLDPDRYLGGYVADFAAWYRALTDQEIQGLCSGSSPQAYAGLIYHFPLYGYDAREESLTGSLVLTGSNDPQYFAHPENFRLPADHWPAFDRLPPISGSRQVFPRGNIVYVNNLPIS